MVDDNPLVVVDSSPLIYLAKLQALDVFRQAGVVPVIPLGVLNEVATPALAYVHRDAATIADAVEAGVVRVQQLGPAELSAASALSEESGLGRGEAEVLALAAGRGLSAVRADRRGRNVARVLGVEALDIVELLFAGTTDNAELLDRIRRFARLTSMRVDDYESLRLRVENERPR